MRLALLLALPLIAVGCARPPVASPLGSCTNIATTPASRIAACTGLIDRTPDPATSANLFFLRGRAKRDAGDLPGAVLDYDEAVRRRPTLGAAWSARGREKVVMNDREAALVDINEGLRLNPGSRSAYSLRGLAQMDRGQRAAAAADFDTELRINPNDLQALGGRGVLREEQGDLPGAFADLNRAAGMNIGGDSRRLLGNAQRNRGELQAALNEYNIAVLRGPREALPYADRCIAMVRLGQAELGLRDCDAAIAQATPYQSWPHAARAGVALAQNDLGTATARIEEALRRDPRSGINLQLRSLLRRRQGDRTGAATDAAEAARINPAMPARVRAIFDAGVEG